MTRASRGAFRRPRPALAAAVAAVLVAACGGGPGEETAPQHVVNQELGIALDIPADAGFTVAENRGDVLRLASAGGADLGPGTVTFAAGPLRTAGVNLVEAVNDRKQEIEAAGGQFLGQIELGSQLGPAYSTRGRLPADGGQEVEEIRIFAVHPSGDRLLWLTYRYTPRPGETRARVDQALEVMGWIAAENAGAGDAGEGGAEGAAPAAPAAPGQG